MLRLDDFVKELSTTTGTGSYTLAGAATGFQSFASAFSTGDTVYYSATDGTNWETGIGTFTSPSTLARTVILASSNSDAAVNWGSGTKTIVCTLPATYGPLAVKLTFEDIPTILTTTTASDPTNDELTYDGPHTCVTGQQVMLRGQNYPNLLNDDSVYYVRAVSSTVLAFYLTKADADADTNRVDIQATSTTRALSKITTTFLNRNARFDAVTPIGIKPADAPDIHWEVNGSVAWSTTALVRMTFQQFGNNANFVLPFTALNNPANNSGKTATLLRYGLSEAGLIGTTATTPTFTPPQAMSGFNAITRPWDMYFVAEAFG